MFEPVKIAPSILSANLINLERDLALIEEAGADMVHVDVMDGHFVPNLTFGVPLVKQLKRTTFLPLDVHLMIDNPLRELPWFLDAGADMVTVHIESLKNEEEARMAIETIHAAGARAALAVKPKTSIDSVLPYITALDMVLVMSVEPGFSGQSYIEGSECRTLEVATFAREHKCSPLIQLDGGIGSATVGRVTSAGADVVVCGNAVFGAPDPADAIAHIREAGNAARIAALGGTSDKTLIGVADETSSGVAGRASLCEANEAREVFAEAPIRASKA